MFKKKKPPFPSFAASAIYQIELGLMDEWLDTIIKTANKRKRKRKRA